MKIIFADVDGCLNCNSTKAVTPSGCVGVADKYIKRLKKIIDLTGAQVVLSSDWKLANEKDYRYLTNKLYYKGGIRIISQTPNIRWDWRGHEIREWLYENRDVVENYVVLDDIHFADFDDGDFYSHVVLTNPDEGLTDEDVDRAIEILNSGVNQHESICD